MPDKNTFNIKPIRQIIHKYTSDCEVIIDPFANTSSIATITNDLCQDYETNYHMDALDFLKTFGDKSVDAVLYDPPYSLRQISECYKSVGIRTTSEMMQSSWRSKQLDEIARIVKPRGKVPCFGWNSSGVGKARDFELVEILLVAHGGSHNDTIVTVDTKIR
jgi:hypothetical protein